MRRGVLLPGLLLGVMVFAAPAKAATITFESQTVKPGELFEVSIVATGIEDLFSFSFDFAFNPSLVVGSPTVTVGDVFSVFVDVDSGLECCFFAGSEPEGPVDGRSVIVGISQLGLFGTPEATTGTLARIQFLAGATGGDASLSLLNLLLVGFNEQEIAADVIDGIVTVDRPPTPVPEPSTLGLLGIGLAAMARRMRRKSPQSIDSAAH